jgi:hypothetical protein
MDAAGCTVFKAEVMMVARPTGASVSVNQACMIREISSRSSISFANQNIRLPLLQNG